jgi:hypothetical protein
MRRREKKLENRGLSIIIILCGEKKERFVRCDFVRPGS